MSEEWYPAYKYTRKKKGGKGGGDMTSIPLQVTQKVQGINEPLLPAERGLESCNVDGF